MHILFIPSWYSTPENPTRGSFFREMALAFQERGHQVGLIVPPARLRTRQGLLQMKRAWRQRPTHWEVANDGGLPTYRMPWWGPTATFAPDARMRLALAAFDAYCQREGQPDVIHAHSLLPGGYLGAYISQSRGLPLVLMEHASFVLNGLIWPDQRPVLVYALKQAGKVFALSPRLADALKRYHPVEVEISGEFLNTKQFGPLRLPPPRPPFIFIAIAQLRPIKRFDLLLRAFAQAFRGQDVLLNIGGGGRERDRLEALAHELNLQTQVRFLGRLTRHEVSDLIATSHALVSSSDTETFGLTLAEAMVCGRPVVATRSGGPESFVTEDSGLLVPTGNVNAFAAALQEMVDTYDRYDPTRIRAGYLERFGEDVMLARFEAAYQELI